MSKSFFNKAAIFILLSFAVNCNTKCLGQSRSTEVNKAADKIETGFAKNNNDTLAQGYFDMGKTFYQNGDLLKGETYFKKARSLYVKIGDADKLAKISRALAQVQEDLHQYKPAYENYYAARENSLKAGDKESGRLNTNDFIRLLKVDSLQVQNRLLQANIDISKKNKDSNEVAGSYKRMAQMNSSTASTMNSVNTYMSAASFSQTKPQEALNINQLITDAYLRDKNYTLAIQTKEQILREGFVQNSPEVKAAQITSLASIYILQKDDSAAARLLREAYKLSADNGHTMAATTAVVKLDSIYSRSGETKKRLDLYKNFLTALPVMIVKDSSLADNKLVAETEHKIKSLENESANKNSLIRRKNLFNIWLICFVALLAVLLAIILFILRKLKIKNKKIALQSLRREMNPHFIFNSLNSINQFIAANNEIEANRYLSRFSALMRKVMENSKEDFVLFSDERALLQNYLELEKSRFPDKFDFVIHIDDVLHADEHFFIPGMLIQPYLENAIWHGLRYLDKGGLLELSFTKLNDRITVVVADNGIGIEESQKIKTVNQNMQSGRGIKNTMERIKILNGLYRQQITCTIIDKPVPDHGVIVSLSIPFLKDYKA